MDINDIIIYVMAFFAIFGAIDRVFGNRFGLGKKFEEGIMTIGSLCISMVGILVLSPVIANVLRPVLVPIANLMDFDPAMAIGMILANDLGGATLAQEIALTSEAAELGGLVTGSMMGATIVFTIPVALGIVSSEDHVYVAKGVLAGLTTIPLGCFFSGLVAGYQIEMILKNIFPIILLVLFIVIGLVKKTDWMLKGFIVFGKAITMIITLGLGIGIFQGLTGMIILEGTMPIEKCFSIVVDIVMVLAGAFPFVFVITETCKKPLQKLGKCIGINETAASGLVVTLANSVPMFVYGK